MSFTRELCCKHQDWAVDATRREEVPGGWHEIVAGLFELVGAAMDRYPGQRLAVQEVAEAFGGLRVRLAATDPAVGARAAVPDAVLVLVAGAEERSLHTCARCGGPGCLRVAAGRFATLCDTCAELASAPVAGEDDGAAGREPERSPADEIECEPEELNLGPECGDDDDDHAGTPVRPPGHLVMDRDAIRAALRAAGYDGTYEAMSAGEEQRARMLVQYRDDDLFRPHLIATPATLAHLDALDRAAPNFAAMTRLVRRAAQVSCVACTPLRVQPTVLLGSPGIGKSRYARLLAGALGTSCDVVNGATLPDVGSLTGYPPVWRGSGPGYLAKMLLSAKTSGPLLFVDEAEKIVDYENVLHPLDRLLPILERDTARTFKDECLQVPIQAQHAIVLFACNGLDALSEPFRDRVLIVHVPDLSPAQRDAVLEAMLAEVGRELGLSVSLAGPEALAPLRALGTRRCRLAIELAVGRAVEQERRFVTAADLAEAVTLLAGSDEPRARAGFIRHGATDSRDGRG